MAEQNSHINRAEELLATLHKNFRYLERRGRITQLFLLAGILLTGFSLLLLSEKFLFLSVVSKSVVWASILIIAIVATVWFGKRHVKTDFTKFYRRFCNSRGLNNLENALDLYLDPSKEKSGLYLLAIERNLKDIDRKQLDVQLSQYISRHPKHQSFIVSASFVLISMILAGTATWSSPDSAMRTVNFWQEYDKPNPYNFVIAPGDTTIEHGSSFEPQLRFTGNSSRLPERVSLAIKTDIEDEYRYRPMVQSGDQTFGAAPFELTSNATYYIRMDEFSSETHDVNVQLRPRFENLTVHVEPPAYTGLSSSVREYPFAVERAYGGSDITIEGTANKQLNELTLSLGETELPMTQVIDTGDGQKYSASFTFTENDTVSFNMLDIEGLRNRNTFRFRLSMTEDEYPVVFIREPANNLSIAEPEQLDIFYQAADDFGLTRAQLNWELRRAFSNEPDRGSRNLDRPVVGEPSHISWNLGDLALRPRDQLTFWITVWDNDEFNGYKSSDSQHLILEVPSVSAFLDEIDQRERNVQDAMDEVSDSYRQMEEEYQRFKESLQENEQPGWEEEQILEDVQNQQQEIEESINKLNEQFEEIQREVEGSSQVSDETRNAYRELQDLLEQLDDPELLRALEELRRSMQELNMNDLERAMEEFEFNEQVYKERLERTLELFKTLKMNSDLDKLAAQYDDLSERMQDLSESEKSTQEQSEEQKGVREDTEHIGNQLENLDSRPPRRSEERLRQLKEETGTELREIQDKLDELIEQTSEESGNNMEELQQEQQNLSRQLEQRAQSLRDAQQQMDGQQIQVNLLALQQSLYTLLELSDSQEDLTRSAGRTESHSQGYVDLAREQQNIRNQFTLVADTLFKVSSEIPTLSNTINRKKAEIERTLERTVEQMAEREQRTSVIMTRESLGGINNLASMLAEAIDQLMNQQSGGAGGGMSLQQMIEQMQNMSGEQQMMNDQLQQFINDIQGERLNQEESARLEQLARQQNEIRKQLENLQRSGALREGDRALSELQRMAEQMEDAINDMRGGITDPLMIERQQNILSRMLDAEESLQERGESEEYEGRRVQEYERTIPPDITLEELRQEIRTRLQDPQYTRFRDDYQRLIERYFELLRRFEEAPLP